MFPDHCFHKTLDVSIAELGFGLTFKLRLRNFNADDCGQSFPGILSLYGFISFNDPVFIGIQIYAPGQCSFKTSQMGAAFLSMDVIAIGKNIFLILAVVLQRQFKRAGIALGPDINGLFKKRILSAIYMLYKAADAALEKELLAFLYPLIN